ncbi:MAG: sigma-54-dependent transcriptional regulator [Desulfurivibrionaceae bacterium]|jgi:two-component system response regulator FlrC|nr:sigma-54 dependent transcriptional regulator [Pseudomonadota bacterium]MCG2822739.1 sigma-54 dependent transcriptional regulator [Desulfobulbaceae bacterium]MDP2003776.1 sigma-54 dependent transcriptional regulator [Desulfurivibrionaceae bacterium]MDP2757759.1 sigma-54 dependent transcriptional regulator [Desulfurivibrionaceae bacterium]
MPEQTHTILIVDDEQNMRVALFEALSRNGHDVAVAENGQMALEMIAKHPPDLVVTDIKMPGMDGLELLRQVKALRPELPVVIMTGFATVDTAVEAMKQGAFDYLLKPFPVEVIEETVARVFALGSKLGQPSAKPVGHKTGEVASFEKPIIGKSPKLLQLMARARSVASSKATVLILGESGTGKEVFARFIHNESDRRNGPFVALNCAALPEGLLESELFGHEKGAFTGAIVTKKGKFELADGGTLLLDEIGEIPLHLQAKLLRVLQEEEVDRLGGRAPCKIDVHVLATTNRDLEQAVKEGAFRQDLYYRLNVIPLKLPPLRERREDVGLLVDFFIRKYAAQYGKPEKKPSAGVWARLSDYDWPGNVREMENLIERAMLLSQGSDLELWDFWDDVEPPARIDSPAVEVSPPSGHFAVAAANTSAAMEIGTQTLREVERQMILQALQANDNNRTHAAEILGISVRTLRNKLHEYRSQGMIE